MAAEREPVIVVLDDDPTGVQTVHDISVYTFWDAETIREAFAEEERMFFLLTNSRSLPASETEQLHAEIARNIASAAAATERDFLLVSRGDSTLRGHWPLETETLRQTLEAETPLRFDGEVIYPFFLEGGRITAGNIHYVLQGGQRVPAGETEFARDKSFGYSASSLPEWVEEKSHGRFRAEDCVCISLEDLRGGDLTAAVEKLCSVQDFGKVIVNSETWQDAYRFTEALRTAMAAGKRFLFRTAAAFPKAVAGVTDRPLLQREELRTPANPNGGIILIGSHVQKTTRQLEELRASSLPLDYIEFNQHRVLEKGGLADEAKRVLRQAEADLASGRSAVVFTRRERLDLDTDDPDAQLRISTEISDALTGIIGNLCVTPSFIVAKGGITSSDVGTKALKVRKARVMGQIRPGIPVWQTGAESRFPGLPYVIFPGNVGDEKDLLRIAEILSPASV